MNILKRIKWTKIVPTLLLVLLATCSLMLVARSQDSALISKADYINQYISYYSSAKNPSDWVQDNNYIIRSSFIPLLQPVILIFINIKVLFLTEK